MNVENVVERIRAEFEEMPGLVLTMPQASRFFGLDQDVTRSVVERLVKWTRDGKSIAFLNSPHGVQNIWLQPLDGGAAKPLTDFASDSVITFNWNQDGSQLAAIRGAETSDVLLLNRSSK